MAGSADDHSLWLKINGVVTRVVRFGFKEEIRALRSPIVLMISGNPGEVDYYSDLLYEVHCKTGLPVLGVSHAGHNVPPKGHSLPAIADNEDLYSLNGQIFHKKCFIEEYISRESKLVLIGHSIGCYIVLELLNRYDSIRSQVLHSILIFPTIESMGDTSEALKYKFLFGWFKYPLLGLSYILDQLSDDYKQKLVAFMLRMGGEKDVPQCVLTSATNLLHPNCLRALIHMSLIEFKTVNQLNREAIERNEQKLTFLYGDCDQWCPLEYYRRIHLLYPNCDIRLCLKHMNHAFVMNRESTSKVCQLIVHQMSSIVNY